MLEFIIGRAGSGKTRVCLEAVQAELRRNPLGPALILLLPEHMTYKVERQLAASMKGQGDGYMRAAVFGFRRFARQVLLETGGGVYPRITEIGKRLLLKKALEKQEKKLQAFQRAARQRGFTASLAQAIEEFKSYGISAPMLQKAAGSLSDEHLQQKLADLACLYGTFSESMEGRYNDAEDMLETLAERLSYSEHIAGAEIWVDGFLFFNPQERKILRALLPKVKHVHVTLTCDPRPSAENIREAGLFHRAWETMQELQQMAAELAIDCRVCRLAETKRFQVQGLQELEKRLFQFPLAAVSGGGAGVQVVEAATRRLEVEAAAADMIRLCREKDLHWRDIGVLVRDEEAYAELLPLVLQDYQIPFFSDHKRASIHHPLAELVRSAFEVLHGWRYEAVFRCIKTDFFPITRGQADILENYVLAFGIRGRRWTQPEPWSYRQSFSLEEIRSEEITEEEQLALDQINQIRGKVVRPLQALEQSVREAKDVQSVTTALYDFLLELAVPQHLSEWAERAEKQGRLAEAREHQQIWTDLMELLEQLVETSGSEAMNLREYEGILGDGLDALQLSLIPPGLDYVTLASFDQNSLDNLAAVYVLGVNEGIMPRHSREKGLLSDADRLHLNEAGLELSHGALEGSFAENYLLYKGFTESRSYLWLSYPLADSEGTGLHASSLVKRIRKILPESSFVSIPLESMERQDTLLLASGRPAVSGLAAALRGYREKHLLSPFWQDVYNWALSQEEVQPVLQMILQGLFAAAGEDRLPPQIAARLYTDRRHLRGSVTRFESFRQCPFQHFARYGLQLRERAEYRFQAPDFGTLLHGTLRDFGERLKAEGRRWCEVGNDECHRICQDILAKLAPRLQNEILLSTAQYKNLLARIEATAESSIQRLIAFDQVSAFHPVAFERSFGAGPEAMPPLVYSLSGDFTLEIIGQIDRIDLNEEGKYFMIFDYKTGNAYINLIEVYYGLRIQLLTYLLVARNLLARTQERPALPAGMLYCLLKNPIYRSNHKLSAGEAKAAIRKDMRMPGWVLAEPEVIRTMDAAADFIKVRLTGKGIHGSDLANVKTEEEFGILLDYIACILVDTGEQILSGDIGVHPYRLKDREACTYCAYKAVCGFDMQLPGYVYRDLLPHADAEVMDAMEWKGREKFK